MREELPRNCWTPPSPRRLNLRYRRYKAAFGMPQPRIRQFSSIIILVYIYIHIYHPIFWWFPLRFSAARPYSASRRILVALYEGPPPEPAKALSEFVCQNAGVMNVGILKDPRNGSWWFIWEYQGKSMENQWNCWRFLNVLDPVLVYSYKNVQEELLSSLERWSGFDDFPALPSNHILLLMDRILGGKTQQRKGDIYIIHLPYQLVQDLSISSSGASFFGSCCFASSSRLCRFPQPNNLPREVFDRRKWLQRPKGIPRCGKTCVISQDL